MNAKMSKPALQGTLTFSTSQLKQKFLCCPGCSSEYNDSDNFARLLPCLHSLCNQCVENLSKDGSVQCPGCEQKHAFDKGTAFPRDNTRQDLMDFVRVKMAPGAILCQGCRDTKQANFRCKNCSEFLCEECRDAHKKTNLTRTHDLLELQALQKKENLDAFCHQQKCPTHDRDLELYCNKEDCQKPICYMCALVSHTKENGHDIKEVMEISNDRKENMRALIQNVNTTGQEVSDVIEYVNQEVLNVQDLGRHLESEIDGAFDQFVRVLNLRRDELKRDVQRYVEIKCGTLGNQLKSLKQHKRAIYEASEFADQTLMYNNPPAFLQIENTVVDRLDKLHKEDFAKEPYEVATIGFHSKGLENDIQNKVTTMAKVWSSHAYKPNCELNPKQNIAVQDESVTFNGVLRSYNRQTLTEDIGNLKATITDPQGTPIDARVYQNGSEGFRITFIPFDAGEYKLEIGVLDKTLAVHDFHVKPRDKPRGSNFDTDQLEGANRIDFRFETKKAHKDVTVTPDGKTFINSPSGTLKESVKDRLHKFKGTLGDHPLLSPGKYFYEINVRYNIRAQLEKSNLVFEIGIARKSEIDKRHVVDGQAHAWSMICSQHDDCGAICLHIARDKKCLYHETLSKNSTGCTMEKTFGYLLDTLKGVWTIFDVENNKVMCKMDDIDCTEPLVPVVSGYNPNQVEVTMTICSAEE